MKHDELDQFIFNGLEKNELEIPQVVHERVRRRAEALASPPRRSVWGRLEIWAPLLAAALLVLVMSLPLLVPPRPAIKKISQIRTEFSIPDKKIKILWVQRNDFHLPDTNG